MSSATKPFGRSSSRGSASRGGVGDVHTDEGSKIAIPSATIGSRARTTNRIGSHNHDTDDRVSHCSTIFMHTRRQIAVLEENSRSLLSCSLRFRTVVTRAAKIQERPIRLPIAVLIISLVASGVACGYLPSSRPNPTSAATPEPEPQSVSQVRPPLTPRWVYEPWVWEDEYNNAQAVRELVEGYRQRTIPVGVVIIDSPWQTNYNTLLFNSDYPDPAGLVRELHDRGIRVILWVTGFINTESDDGPDPGKASNYDEAHAAGYFVDGGRTVKWDKGRGSAIDFFNPDAVRWWYSQMDRAFAVGVDGWKVDSPEGNLPPQFQTAAGLKTEREYGEAYYRAMYRYVVERKPDAVTLARATDSGTTYAPVDANPAGWSGDQNPGWAGLREAFDDVATSSRQGFSAIGSDIGGYRRGERSERVFMRWTQFGALVPLMENGGRGEHRPWLLGPRALENYRYYATLHHELVPYLYSAGMVAHRTGTPIVRNADSDRKQYELGPDFLVAPILSEGEAREVTFPPDTRWYDYWDDDVVQEGGRTIAVQAPEDRIPLYIRSGAIIPLQVEGSETGHGDRSSSGRLTLLIYPASDSTREYHAGPDDTLLLQARREGSKVTVATGSRSELYTLRIKEPSGPAVVSLARGGIETRLPQLQSGQALTGAEEGWYYDEDRHHVWVRFATDQTDAQVTYTSRS